MQHRSRFGSRQGRRFIVTSLIDLTYQSRGKLMITTWLTLGSEISPRFGVTGAHYVARVTNFLTETRTGKIVSKVAGEVVSPGDLSAIC